MAPEVKLLKHALKKVWGGMKPKKSGFISLHLIHMESWTSGGERRVLPPVEVHGHAQQAGRAPRV